MKNPVRTSISSIFLVMILLCLGFILAACGKDGTVGQAETHEKAAALLINKGDYTGAIVEYGQAIALNPKSDIAYEGRGQAHVALKNYDPAVADFTKAIGLRPDRGGPYFDRGSVCRLQGNLDNAISDLSHAIGDISKTKWRAALYERGLAYKTKGNLAEARADFERIIQLEAENPGEADKSWAELAQKELSEMGPVSQP